jgi:transposase-like protein
VTLRFDEHGKPIGLDWSVCNDGNPTPQIWMDWRPRRAKAGGQTVEQEAEGRQTHDRKRLSPATEALIIRLYRDENKSARECAETAGVKSPTVFKVLARNGIASRGYHQTSRSVTREQSAEIVRLYTVELQSSGQISKALGIGTRAVSRALVNAGVTIRSASESAKLDRARRLRQTLSAVARG